MWGTEWTVVEVCGPPGGGVGGGGGGDVALHRHCLHWTASMVGSEEPVMRWAVFTSLCSAFPIRDRAVATPYCDAIDEDALNSAAGRSSPESEETDGPSSISSGRRDTGEPSLPGLRCWGSKMWTPGNLKLVTCLTSVQLIQMGVSVPPLVFL